MEEKELFGKLFNVVPLYDENHLETILETMNSDGAVFLLIQAVKHAYHSGIYSIGESEVISKSIRILSKNQSTHQSTE
jgi:hypothetical protein